MNLNVSTWSIHNPVAITLLFVLLSLAGAAGFAAMKVQDFPDIDFPIVTVSAELPGASPAQMENEVARKIEDALARLQGIKHIKSRLSDGVATITAEFVVDKAAGEAMADVRDAVTSLRANLPADLQDPVINRVQLASTPVLTFAVASDRQDAEALSWLVDGQISKRLLRVPGVGAVARVGGVDREVSVALDPERLLALNTTAAEISARLRQVQQEEAGGRIQSGQQEQSVRMLATVQSAADLAALELPLADGRRVRLDQLADVSDHHAEPRSLALLDGQPVVSFDVLRSRGAGELEVAEGVRVAMEELRQAHPEVDFTEAVNHVDPIRENYQGSMLLLYEGAALAVLVVFCFLRDARATLIAAVALPLSALPTFAVMHLLGFSLNTVSLLSLSLVVGVLVDDAIVEIENIERHLLTGKPPLRAATDAANEIGLAVIATTFTLIAVFVPTSLMGGIVGKYFVQFGWTAAVAVFFSLLVARMLTPTLAAYLLTSTSASRITPRWVMRYLRLVRGCLDHPRRSLLVAALAIAAGLVIATTLPGEFMPADDGDQTQVSVLLPPGSQLAETQRLAERARLLIMQQPQVRSVHTAIGVAGASADPDESTGPVAGVGMATLTVNLIPRKLRDGVSRQQVEQQLRQRLADLPGARISIGAGDGERHELVLAADDGQRLAEHAAVVERELRRLPGVGAVTSSASLVRPELVVRPDFARAADLGVTSADIAQTLRVATVGDYPQDLSKLNLSERQVPVSVRLADHARDDIDTIRRLPVPGALGPVPLESVADFQWQSGPAELSRYDRMRNINLTIELNGQPLGTVEAAAAALPSLRQLPRGIVLASAGDAEVMGELAAGFALAMLAGVLCIYSVLVLLLKDFVQPVTVLAALLLSIPGAFIALWLAGASLSMPSMIGLIMLMGISTKNAILLVDYIILARRELGLNRRRAIIDACRKRARPILMTTIAMGAGMLPIALGLGADPSFRAPMAIVVIGGLITSTVLCLLVVPVLYTVIDEAELRVGRWLRRDARGAVIRAVG